MWYVYIVQCADGTFYTGCTVDVERRLREHNSSKRGARYCKARRPVTLKWVTTAGDRSSAQTVEHRIKKLGHEGKSILAFLRGR